MIVEQKKAASGTDNAITPVSLVVDYDGAEDLILDYNQNLSSGRVFLTTPRQLDVGTPVHLRLAFPGLRKPIGIRGVVGWTREGDDDERGIGIELDEGESRDLLREQVIRVRERDPELVMRLIRVLVVEDNPHVDHLIRHGLSGTGRRELPDDVAFNFRTATNGREALDLLHSSTFDVLIVDVYLPILDGAHVIQHVRADERLRKLPIVAVSAGGKSARDAAITAGANVFLEKPMRLRQLLDAMRGFIDVGG